VCVQQHALFVQVAAAACFTSGQIKGMQAGEMHSHHAEAEDQSRCALTERISELERNVTALQVAPLAPLFS
jgi:hypothetical protein